MGNDNIKLAVFFVVGITILLAYAFLQGPPGDSCGGYNVSLDKLGSYCRNINFQTLTFSKSGGKFRLDGIERLELAGFNSTGFVSSSNFNCSMVGSVQDPNAYIECTLPLSVFDDVLDNSFHTTDVRRILIDYITFDYTTKKVRSVSCYCDIR